MRAGDAHEGVMDVISGRRHCSSYGSADGIGCFLHIDDDTLMHAASRCLADTGYMFQFPHVIDFPDKTSDLGGADIQAHDGWKPRAGTFVSQDCLYFVFLTHIIAAR